MQKSTIYYTAQICVLQANLDVKTSLEVLRELMDQEDVARYIEEKKVEKE